MSKANKNLLGYVGSKPGTKRDSDSWYTPPIYIESARKVLGGIDLDPFSSVEANKRVNARRFFTVDKSAFDNKWKANSVWMNPPYSRGLSALAVERFINQFEAGNFDKGIILMNASTDTKWFHALASRASAICFTLGRISFTSGADYKQSSGNTKGQVFFYFGKDVQTFKQEFGVFGLVVQS